MNEAFGFQIGDRLAHDRATHIEFADHVLLGRQPFAALVMAGGDPVCNSLNQLTCKRFSFAKAGHVYLLCFRQATPLVFLQQRAKGVFVRK